MKTCVYSMYENVYRACDNVYSMYDVSLTSS